MPFTPRINRGFLEEGLSPGLGMYEMNLELLICHSRETTEQGQGLQAGGQCCISAESVWLAELLSPAGEVHRTRPHGHPQCGAEGGLSPAGSQGPQSCNLKETNCQQLE